MTVRLRSTSNGWVFGNVLLGGIMGLLIDYGTGAAYTLTPDNVDAHLDTSEGQVRNGRTLRLFDSSGDVLLNIHLEDVTPQS